MNNSEKNTSITIGSINKVKKTSNDETIKKFFDMFPLNDSECILCKEMKYSIIDGLCRDCITGDDFAISKNTYNNLLDKLSSHQVEINNYYVENIVPILNDDVLSCNEFVCHVKTILLKKIRENISPKNGKELKKLFDYSLFFYIKFNPAYLLYYVINFFVDNDANDSKPYFSYNTLNDDINLNIETLIHFTFGDYSVNIPIAFLTCKK